jgi:acetate kinase
MVATLGGIDALIFTAGVGERSTEIRKRVCQKLKYLGLDLDPASNENCQPDADIATLASTVRILVIATREDLTIMRETLRLVASSMTQHPRAKITETSLIDR